MTKQIFISYSRRDSAFVNQFYDTAFGYLGALGFSFWLDRSEIRAGDSWWEAILDNIENSVAVLFMMSASSLSSEYCKAEILYARCRDCAIFPIVIEPVTIINDDLAFLDGIQRLEVQKDISQLILHLLPGLMQAQHSSKNCPRPSRPIDDPLRLRQTTAQERRDIGIQRAKEGWPPGSGLKENGSVEIAWHRVEASDKVYIDMGEDRKEAYPVKHPFYIARYPITQTQFQSFVQHSDGYDSDRWWQGLNRLPPTAQQAMTLANAPQTYINWYESIAYCRWLMAYLPNANWPEDNMKDRGWVMRLPTEAEWQLAAGGVFDRLYPWGHIWEDWRCNSGHNQLRQLMAVGVHPGGESPYGAHDMLGNVREWCMNLYEDPGMVDPDVPNIHQRSSRGGSFEDVGNWLTINWRDHAVPLRRDPRRGFRLVCALPFKDE